METIQVSIGARAGLSAGLSQVRLFDADLGVPSLEVYQEQYYMPGNSRGFRRLDAGRKPPPNKWWGATHGNEWELLCHPMTVIQLSPRRRVLVGFATGSTYEAYLLFNTRGPTIRLSAWCNLYGRLAGPGRPLTMEELVVIRGQTFAECAEAYAHHVAGRAGARVPKATVGGWSDWQYWREEKTEKDLLESLPVLAKLRRQGFPIRYLIVDGGWCDHASEWLSPCPKYPSGMKKIAARLRRDGLELGLWLAPYLTNVHTNVVKQHPEWLVLDAAKDEPLTRKTSNVGPCCMLDFTAPGALDWLRNVVRTFVRDWKIGYLKLDGPSLAHYLGGRFHDDSFTPIEVIRRGLEVIRQECGEGVIVEGEGLFGPSIGLVDTQRVSQDNHPFWYDRQGHPCLKENLANELLGSYMHGVYWHNHRENVILRDFLSPFHAWGGEGDRAKDCMLSENELRSYLSGAVLSGGAMLLTEPMAQLARSPSRMDLIGRFLPHYEGGRCRAIDAFRGDGRQPAIYAMRVERDFETWHVVGIFNLDDQYEDFELDLEPIAGKGAFHVFEYWNQEYLGRRRGTLAVRDVPAHGCKILSIRRATGRPQLVGSGMHILQGAVDIAECGFDRDTLRIAVVHPVQKDRTLFIWRPSSRILSGVKTNARDYLVDARDKRILRIHFNGRRRTEFELRWKRTNAR